jgi:hypothetical protein
VGVRRPGDAELGLPRFLTLGVDIAVPHAAEPGGTTVSGTGGETLAVTGDPISSIAMFGLCLLLAGLAFVTLSRLRFTAG